MALDKLTGQDFLELTKAIERPEILTAIAQLNRIYEAGQMGPEKRKKTGKRLGRKRE